MTLPRVFIFTDGSCSPNPGKGGWGVVLIAPDHNNHRKELSGAEDKATNNRMELRAAIEALKALRETCEVTLHTDSKYLHDAFVERWLEKWKQNGWRTSDKEPVKNQDLWQELDVLIQKHSVTWAWQKGHSTNIEINRCDALANEAREKAFRI